MDRLVKIEARTFFPVKIVKVDLIWNCQKEIL